MADGVFTMDAQGRISSWNPSMERISGYAAAASEATILVQGESGTGIELVAGAIHFNRERRDGPPVTVNCSALAENLLESELVGHVKGSFAGANRDRGGRFEEASAGTIFLDEIGELSPFRSSCCGCCKREIECVGDSRRRKIDIRIITATHKDLYARVREGLFRKDLYCRLKVFPIQLPPLWERREDIPFRDRHCEGLRHRPSFSDTKQHVTPYDPVFKQIALSLLLAFVMMDVLNRCLRPAQVSRLLGGDLG